MLNFDSCSVSEFGQIPKYAAWILEKKIPYTFRKWLNSCINLLNIQSTDGWEMLIYALNISNYSTEFFLKFLNKKLNFT